MDLPTAVRAAGVDGVIANDYPFRVETIGTRCVDVRQLHRNSPASPAPRYPHEVIGDLRTIHYSSGYASDGWSVIESRINPFAELISTTTTTEENTMAITQTDIDNAAIADTATHARDLVSGQLFVWHPGAQGFLSVTEDHMLATYVADTITGDAGNERVEYHNAITGEHHGRYVHSDTVRVHVLTLPTADPTDDTNEMDLSAAVRAAGVGGRITRYGASCTYVVGLEGDDTWTIRRDRDGYEFEPVIGSGWIQEGWRIVSAAAPEVATADTTVPPVFEHAPAMIEDLLKVYGEELLTGVTLRVGGASGARYMVTGFTDVGDARMARLYSFEGSEDTRALADITVPQTFTYPTVGGSRFAIHATDNSHLAHDVDTLRSAVARLSGDLVAARARVRELETSGTASAIVPRTVEEARSMIRALEGLVTYLPGGRMNEAANEMARDRDLCGEYEAIVCPTFGWAPRRSGSADSWVAQHGDAIRTFENATRDQSPAARLETWARRYVSGGEANAAVVQHAQDHLEEHKHDSANALLESFGWDTLEVEPKCYMVPVEVTRTVTQTATIYVHASGRDDDEAINNVGSSDVRDALYSEAVNWETADPGDSEYDDWDIDPNGDGAECCD